MSPVLASARRAGPGASSRAVLAAFPQGRRQAQAPRRHTRRPRCSEALPRPLQPSLRHETRAEAADPPPRRPPPPAPGRPGLPLRPSLAPHRHITMATHPPPPGQRQPRPLPRPAAGGRPGRGGLRPSSARLGPTFPPSRGCRPLTRQLQRPGQHRSHAGDAECACAPLLPHRAFPRPAGSCSSAAWGTPHPPTRRGPRCRIAPRPRGLMLLGQRERGVGGSPGVPCHGELRVRAAR